MTAPRGMPSRSSQDVLDELSRMSVDDVDWKNGRVFSLAYFAGDDVLDVAERAYALYSSANGLNTDAFPSLRRIQADIIAWTTGLVHGDHQAAGFLTSGGTESILLAVEAARRKGRAEKQIDSPNIVLPASAHAAFEKACSYFGVDSRRIPVRDDWRADPEAMARAVDDDTVLVVASVPQYPQGVIDPVEDIAGIGISYGINVHVDACMGGIVLPYLERTGELVPPWDFRVPGVTSISIDLHKYGYSSKGASVLLHRNKKLRSYQTFTTDNWLGGFYGSSGILGTKSGGPMAAAWAVMSYLGDEGYEQLSTQARRTAIRLADAVEKIPQLVLRARPDSTLVCFGGHGGIDVFTIADRLRSKGWYVDRQGPPDSLHCTVHAGHESTIQFFIDDLSEIARSLVDSEQHGELGSYGNIE